MLADKAGHHQTISGGSPPWIGPWEYTGQLNCAPTFTCAESFKALSLLFVYSNCFCVGYPKGEPLLTKLVAYSGVAIGVIGVVMSLFIGKLAVGLPAFGSYLALIFVQVSTHSNS